MLDGGTAVFAAEPGQLDAAERQFDRGDVVVVDPAGAGLQLGDDAVGARQIAREHAGGQPEVCGVGALR